MVNRLNERRLRIVACSTARRSPKTSRSSCRPLSLRERSPCSMIRHTIGLAGVTSRISKHSPFWSIPAVSSDVCVVLQNMYCTTSLWYDFPSRSMMAVYQRMGAVRNGELVRLVHLLKTNRAIEQRVSSRHSPKHLRQESEKPPRFRTLAKSLRSPRHHRLPRGRSPRA